MNSRKNERRGSDLAMHSPLAQVASFGPQVINGNGVGLSCSMTLKNKNWNFDIFVNCKNAELKFIFDAKNQKKPYYHNVWQSFI